MSYLFTSPNTGTSLSDQSSDDVRKLYSKVVRLHEQENDFWQEFEGLGEDAFIQTVVDTSKGQGQKIRFTNTTGFYKKGRKGDEYFDSSDYFDQMFINGFDLEVDWLRHGVRLNARAEEYMGLRGELKSKIPQNLAAWMGREKSYRLDQLLLRRGDGRNTMYAGTNNNSVDDLESTDIISLNEVIRMKQELIRVGAKPGMVGKDGRNRIHRYLMVATTDALSGLKKSSAYQQMVRDAGLRGEYNQLFRGGYVDLDGTGIKERFVLDHDGPGPIGSSMNPRAKLGNAITAGTATFTIKGGGDSDYAAVKHVPYFRCFPNFPVEFIPNDTITAGTSSFYIAIVNPMNGDANQGKWGFYKCNANGWSSDLNVLTVEQRLKATDAGGISSDQVGNVTWDAAKNTDTHPIGSTIILTNSSGVPYGYSFMMGQQTAYRGYGQYRNLMTYEEHEGTGNGAFILDRFIISVFGQCLRQDTIARKPGYLTLVHAIDPGVNLNPTLA